VETRRFLRYWCLSFLATVVIVAMVNILIDPYLLFRMPRVAGLNAYKPASISQERLMKGYEVIDARPNTVLLGSSRVDVGMDARHPAWAAADRPVYNLALAGGGPYASYRYLQHVMAGNRVGFVVLGLDFEYFLVTTQADRPPEPEFGSRLLVNHDGSHNAASKARYARDLFRAALSFDAFADSTTTLIQNLSGGRSTDLVDGNAEWQSFHAHTAERGSQPLVTVSDAAAIGYYRNTKRNTFALNDVKEILDLCAKHRARVVVFLNPVHADQLEIYDLLGYWEPFEDWKRELVALVKTYGSSPDAHERIALWDFTDYDSYSTEPVPLDGELMRWFWEPSHYTRELGSAVVMRILSPDERNFGAMLDSENLEQHLAAIRARQQRYRDRHSADVSRVRAIYASMSKMIPEIRELQN
jgi:hypothetical protein